jgi:hypothetical protein
VRANHGEVEKLLDGLDGGTGCEGDAGGVEENLTQEAGEVLASGEHGPCFYHKP